MELVGAILFAFIIWCFISANTGKAAQKRKATAERKRKAREKAMRNLRY